MKIIIIVGVLLGISVLVNVVLVVTLILSKYTINNNNNYYYGRFIVIIGQVRQSKTARRLGHDGVDIIEMDGPRRQGGGELKYMTVLLPGQPTYTSKTHAAL